MNISMPIIYFNYIIMTIFIEEEEQSESEQSEHVKPLFPLSYPYECPKYLRYLLPDDRKLGYYAEDNIEGSRLYLDNYMTQPFMCKEHDNCQMLLDFEKLPCCSKAF